MSPFKKNIALATLVTLLGFGVPFFAFADSVVSGSSNTTAVDSWNLNGDGSDAVWGFQFTANANGTVSYVDLLLNKFGSSPDMTTYFEADASGKPSGTALDTNTFLASTAGNCSGTSYSVIHFSAPVTVVNGNKYWVVLDANPSAGGSSLRWQFCGDGTGGVDAYNAANTSVGWSTGTEFPNYTLTIVTSGGGGGGGGSTSTASTTPATVTQDEVLFILAVLVFVMTVPFWISIFSSWS